MRSRHLGLAAASTLLALALLDGATRAQPAPLPDAAALNAACQGIDPYVAVAVQGGWRPEDQPATEPALLLARQSLGERSPSLASRAQLGDIYGLAYDGGRGVVYAGAWHRSGGRFGPGGPGAVYRVGLADGQVTLLAQLPAGPDRHAAADGSGAAENPDWAGKTGLGDLDLALDGSQLFVANLFDGKVYRLSLPSGQVLGAFAHGSVRERWSRDARMLGLGVEGDWLYHGLVNSREDDSVLGLLEGRVYRSRSDGAEMAQVLRFGLGTDSSYQRGAPWGPWTTEAANSSPDQPLVADIAFLPSGLPVVGLRDRRVDLDPDCVWQPGCPGGASLGDLLPAREREGGSGWELIRSPQWFRDSDAAGLETAWGALAPLPGLGWLVAPARPPDPGYPGAALALDSFDAGSGMRLRSGRILEGAAAPSRLAAGDVAVLCDPGNQVEPEVLVTLTVEAAQAATATAAARDAARATQVVATRTAHAPTQEVRRTAAAETATALQPILTAEAPTIEAGRLRALATAAVEVPRQLTLVAPTSVAIGTAAARATAAPPSTATAYAHAYQHVKDSCQGGNPYLAVTQFVPMTDGSGNAYGQAWLKGQAAVVALNDTVGDDLALHHNLAYQDQVGAVFGVAMDLTRDRIYLGAYTKRLAGYGPLGPGGIYQVDLARGTVLPWAALPAGRDSHRFNQGFDQAAANSVGVTALGDLELTTAGDQLFAVNLSDGYVYRFAVPSGRLLGAFPHGAAGLDWAEDARPFALAWKEGWLFHGVVDSRTRDAQATNNPAPRPLAAYVYRSRPDGSEMTEVLRVDLDYGRQPVWNPWPRVVDDGQTIDQPMLVDIEFREDGDLVLGLRDRQADSRVLIAAGGDMVLTMKAGERYVPLTVPEFYQDNLLHAESSWGTLASLPWLDQVVSTVIDPIQIYSGGLAWYDNVSGYDVTRETVYAGANQTFGKAAGLGDIESLCFALTPTPTVPAATATASSTSTSSPSATATVTASATASPTVTRTPTPGHYAIYLPFTERLLCRPESVFTDAVLVLDMSTSMYRETRGGRSKHAAALDAARAFVAQMKLEPNAYGARDRVAVVGFNDAAWTEIGLSGDRGAVLAALDRLPGRIAQGTRIDLSLAQGQDALARGPRLGNNQPVMILLTDGLPNRVPFGPGSIAPECPNQECTVLKQASAAKDAGSRIFSIGLGETDDVLDQLLGAVASTRADYYFAPDGEDLADIYRGIAGRLTACP